MNGGLQLPWAARVSWGRLDRWRGRTGRWVWSVVVGCWLGTLLWVVPAEGAAPQAALDGDGILATVGEEIISAEEFRVNVHAAYRQRFYHGKVPEDQRLAFRREVAERLVDRRLLLQEAQRRGIEPDGGWVKAQLEMVQERYRRLPHWEERREELLQALREELEAQSRIQRLKDEVEDLPEPDRAAVRAYYEAHPERFTTPQRLHLSLILLRVPPWAPPQEWEAARQKAEELLARLAEGASFAELARAHSSDESAARGGDLGYVHAGMLSTEAQEVVDGLAPGEVSAPIRLLQGYALFRLEARTPPQLNDFARSEARARLMLSEERKAQAWQSLLEELRRKTPITINEALLVGAE